MFSDARFLRPGTILTCVLNEITFYLDYLPKQTASMWSPYQIAQHKQIFGKTPLEEYLEIPRAARAGQADDTTDLGGLYGWVVNG
jgi:hypothetical protein